MLKISKNLINFGILSLFCVSSFESPAFGVTIRNQCPATLFEANTRIHFRPDTTHCRDQWIEVKPNATEVHEVFTHCTKTFQGQKTGHYWVEPAGTIASPRSFVQLEGQEVTCTLIGLVCSCVNTTNNK